MRERISSRLLSALRVLVVDDHLGSRRLLSFVAGASGHEVVSAATPSDAFRVLDEFRPDAIIYDWKARAGELRGFGRTLRDSIASVRALVVVSSLDEPRGFCDEEAVDAYFTKPCAMREVIERVQILVRATRARW